MNDCGCKAPEVKTEQERRVLRIALGLNAAMAVIGGLAGLDRSVCRAAGRCAGHALRCDRLRDCPAGHRPIPHCSKSEPATLSGGILLVLGVASPIRGRPPCSLRGRTAERMDDRNSSAFADGSI